MKLYYHPGASSRSVHMILRELDVPFELEYVDFRTHTTPSGTDYMGVNPKGYVPAIETDSGELLTEVTVVLQYVAEQSPDAGLIPPAGTMERYRVMEWLHFIGSEIQKKCLGPLWHPGIPDEWRTVCLGETSKRFDYLSGQLDGKQYLMGETYTIADAYLFTLLCWCEHLKVPLGQWPVLAQYKDRVGERPATAATLQAESTTPS